MEESNECQELKNLKYKTMLLNGVSLQESKYSNDLSNLDKFLENEKNNNYNDPWDKLNTTIKTKKIFDYVENYKILNELSDEGADALFLFLKDCIDRKRLKRIKDVVYDKKTGILKDIPALCYIKATKHFTLKNIDKRVSTLKSLAPKKACQGTIRKKEIITKDDADSEEDVEN